MTERRARHSGAAAIDAAHETDISGNRAHTRSSPNLAVAPEVQTKVSDDHHSWGRTPLDQITDGVKADRRACSRPLDWCNRAVCAPAW